MPENEDLERIVQRLSEYCAAARVFTVLVSYSCTHGLTELRVLKGHFRKGLRLLCWNTSSIRAAELTIEAPPVIARAGSLIEVRAASMLELSCMSVTCSAIE